MPSPDETSLADRLYFFLFSVTSFLFKMEIFLKIHENYNNIFLLKIECLNK